MVEPFAAFPIRVLDRRQFVAAFQTASTRRTMRRSSMASADHTRRPRPAIHNVGDRAAARRRGPTAWFWFSSTRPGGPTVARVSPPWRLARQEMAREAKVKKAKTAKR